MTDLYNYGSRARCNVGFGLWQMANWSKAPLTAANYTKDILRRSFGLVAEARAYAGSMMEEPEHRALCNVAQEARLGPP